VFRKVKKIGRQSSTLRLIVKYCVYVNTNMVALLLLYLNENNNTVAFILHVILSTTVESSMLLS